LEGPMGL